jgi:outer membrane protein assembly factor BamB
VLSELLGDLAARGLDFSMQRLYVLDGGKALPAAVPLCGCDDSALSGAQTYALDARTGGKLWSYATGNGVYSSPALANGVVYVSWDDGNGYATTTSTH